MPFEARGVSYEAQAVYTGCICPSNGCGYVANHEVGCPTQPLPGLEKPIARAGKRAWKRYFKQRSR